MRYRFSLVTNVRAALCVCCGLLFFSGESSFAGKTNHGDQSVVTANSQKSQKEKKGGTMSHASGTFEVKVTSTPSEDKVAGAAIGRFSLDKQFHGDLEGTSKGEMLTVSSAVAGSAGYVAMELVTGTLNGRMGTFALQHTGTMNRGTPQLSVTVVPDSGTGGFVGLSGKMDIKITDGKHFYEFDYAIAE